MSIILAFARRRARRHPLLRCIRRLCALALALGIRVHFRWVPSEWNVAAKGSRAFDNHDGVTQDTDSRPPAKFSPAATSNGTPCSPRTGAVDGHNACGPRPKRERTAEDSETGGVVHSDFSDQAIDRVKRPRCGSVDTPDTGGHGRRPVECRRQRRDDVGIGSPPRTPCRPRSSLDRERKA